VGIDPNNIFGLFDSGSESQSGEKEVNKIEISEHPLILVGMFTRMVLRGEEVNQDIMKFFQEIEREVTAKEQEHFNKFMIYNRALSFLAQMNLDDPLHVEVLLEKTGEDFLQACQMTIEFYTEREEYEKCAFIKKFQDFIEFSQNKLPL
jgi:hypothetical protein